MPYSQTSVNPDTKGVPSGLDPPACSEGILRTGQAEKRIRIGNKNQKSLSANSAPSAVKVFQLRFWMSGRNAMKNAVG